MTTHLTDKLYTKFGQMRMKKFTDIKMLVEELNILRPRPQARIDAKILGVKILKNQTDTVSNLQDSLKK